jgi:triacylglycerol esterase/lipase EstA (alpha/beta hydrolase family)
MVERRPEDRGAPQFTDASPLPDSKAVLALSLLTLLGMEIWLWLALGHNLFQSGWSLWLAIVLPMMLALLWRAIFVAISFAVAGVWLSAGAGTRGDRLRAWHGEFWAQLRLYTWIQPLLALERSPRAAWQRSGHVPVVLVHGFLCNAGVFSGFIRGLRKRGVDGIFAVNLDPLYRDMPASLALFHHKLQRILRRCNARSAVLVGHSMGGVLVRLYRSSHPDNVAAACAIGAPHHGTLGAKLIGGGRERGPPSPTSIWLQRYNTDHQADCGLLNIWSAADNIVWPQTSAQLHSANELRLTGFGHLHLLQSPVVRDAVARLIRETSITTTP